jgi:hypothetical protein
LRPMKPNIPPPPPPLPHPFLQTLFNFVNKLSI